MYVLLLSWRYLRTRWIALASIISVMLGVATMIVVNSVMAGFTLEMQGRIHGILSDVIVESRSMDGIEDAERHMQQIDKIAGEFIAGMTPTVHVPALLYFEYADQLVTKQVNVIGIDEATYASVSDFGKYLQHPDNRERLSFGLRDGGYDTTDHEAGDNGRRPPRRQLATAGWPYRRQKARFRQVVPAQPQANATTGGNEPGGELAALDPFGRAQATAAVEFDPARDLHTGCVVGIGLCGYRLPDGSDGFLALPGDDVAISFPSTSVPPTPQSANLTIVDFYESKMNEYDASFVFVPIRALQASRGMINRETGVSKFNSIQIRLQDGVELNAVRDLLREHFPARLYSISSWRDKQGPLLAAVSMETAVLNVLLFLIIAVAGFGILAIFFMIVVEKTRDIGILKSLGASGRGVMGIFLGYGLSLGVVGSGVGLIIGLLFVRYINEIADLLGRITGQPVFDPSIYYFHRIPTIVSHFTITWIVLGAMAIAILASVLPARRAARLHPVEALRYE